MQKKRAKKSWQRNQPRICYCEHCTGLDSFWHRLIEKTRVRKKFFKYPQKITLPDE